MMMLHHNERRARQAFAEVEEITAQFTSPQTPDEYAQARHHLLATMLAHPDNTEIMRKQRQQLHHSVIREAQAAYSLSRETWIDLDHRERSRRAGRIAEPTILGLLTRYVHPWMIAVPALEHHDWSWRGPWGTNYDGILVETGPDRPDNNAYRLQCKLGCLGICSNPWPIQVDRRRYRPEITFVSGHCDLGMHTDDTGEWRSSLTDLLVAELNDTATAEEIRILDRATDNLILDITMGSALRRGTMTVS